VKNDLTGKGEEFFVTGLKNYLDAKSAVPMFEQDVRLFVKNVATKHLLDLKELLGNE
jgi:hypothetical protein